MVVVALNTRPVFVTRSCYESKKRAKIIKRKKKLEDCIKHATMICANFEDTLECRLAWGIVEEMSAAEHDIRRREKELMKEIELEDDWWEYLSEREYDI